VTLAADRSLDDRPVRWGLLGTGTISSWIAPEIAGLPDAEVIAVAGRSQAAADAFGTRFRIPNRHGSYRQLLDDPDVDVVYIGVPNPFHAEWALEAIAAGKAVLCEKPFTVTHADAERVVAAARADGVFLMEAMRARYVPSIRRAKTILEEGGIGEVRFVQVDVGGLAPSTALDSRWLSAQLGGGAMLDMGVYALSLACHFAGLPDSVVAVGTLAETGVDLACSAILSYPTGARAVMTTSIDVARPGGAVIVGTRGRIEFEGPMLSPAGGRWIVGDEVREEFESIPFFESMRFEAAEVVRCLRAGESESPVMPLDETLAIMALLNGIRAQLGVRYPFE
jgi:predicted dehydrogenase